MPACFKKREAGGFTLMEIILVLVLITVMAALALPNFRGSFGNIILHTSANQIASLMRYAQARAVTRMQTIEFVLDQEGRTYRLLQIGTEEDHQAESGSSQRVPGRWGRPFSISPELDMKVTQTRFQFTPDGKISPGRIFLCQKDKCCTLSTEDQRSRVLILKGRVE